MDGTVLCSYMHIRWLCKLSAIHTSSSRPSKLDEPGLFKVC